MSKINDVIKTINSLEKWKHIFRNYSPNTITVNDDGSLDVDCSVEFSYDSIRHIPFKFNIVHGDFILNGCPILSLKGCPSFVGGSFYIENCHDLDSLEFMPQEILGIFFFNNGIHFFDKENKFYKQNKEIVCNLKAYKGIECEGQFGRDFVTGAKVATEGDDVYISYWSKVKRL